MPAQRHTVSGEGIPENQGRLPEEVTTELGGDQGELWVQGASLSLLATQMLDGFSVTCFLPSVCP